MKYLIIIILILTGCGTKVNHTTRPVKWDREIFYYYDESVYDRPDIIMNVEKIFDEIEEDSEIDLIFYECAELSKGVVKIQVGEGINSSTVGKCDKPLITLSSGQLCVVYHEILHMLGMMHPHQRPDRDDYVNINMDNIPSKVVSDFNVLSDEMFLYNIYDYDYDYNSVLHYSTDTYSSGMTCIDGSKIHKNKRLSPMDWQKLRNIY